MGWTSFIVDMITGVSLGLSVDNRGNVIFGGGDDRVNGYGNVVLGNGDSHVSGAGNVVFGTNTVSGFGNILLGNNNHINGNGNVVIDGQNNSISGSGNVILTTIDSDIDGDGNVISGHTDLAVKGDSNTYVEDTLWSDTLDFHSDFDFEVLPTISLHNPSSDGTKDGSIILISDLGHNHTSGTDYNDILVGGDNGNAIDGRAGNDIITGGLGFDTLNGGDGHDIIVGEDGNDLLTGGAGRDLFGFSPGEGHDYVADFKIADDTLHFSGKGQLNSLTEVLAATEEATSSLTGENGILIAIPEMGSVFLAGLSLLDLTVTSMQFE